MQTMIAAFRTAITATAFAFSLAAQAQHAHQGDIQPGLENGKLVIRGDFETQFGTGFPIFESAFATLQGSSAGAIRYRSTSPGFDTGEPGPFDAGDILAIRGMGTLRFWNGVAWSNTPPGNEFVRIADALDFPTIDIRFTASGVSGSVGAIADADADGAIHQHLPFYLINNPDTSATTGTVPADGAYLIQAQLVTTTLVDGLPKYADSDPFMIAFNRGLSGENFHAAVEILAVPEPSAALMILPALGIVAWRVRRTAAARS